MLENDGFKEKQNNIAIYQRHRIFNIVNFKRYCHKCGNTDNPNAQTKQSEQSVKKEHNLINMKKLSNHDEEADIVVEVEHPVETTDDE